MEKTILIKLNEKHSGRLLLHGFRTVQEAVDYCRDMGINDVNVERAPTYTCINAEIPIFGYNSLGLVLFVDEV